jgi:methylthioribose-1-phosphate isomerase
MTQSPAEGPLEPLRRDAEGLWVLDQRRLPDEEHWLLARDADEVADAIRSMAVRGAPAIGIAAAYGAALAATRCFPGGTSDGGPGDGTATWERALATLAASRPTAVNLAWALARMRRVAARALPDPRAALAAEAAAIHAEDRAQNLAMAALGAAYLGAGSRVLTHCNTGALATGGHGTALGVIRSAWREGRIERVYATETRPWLQGARLTAWELARDRIPVTLIVEGAAAHTIERAGIGWLLVGADRIAANGDVANKVGTHGLALLARALGARVMVVAPSSTVDMATASGAAIPIEERDGHEVWEATGSAAAPNGLVISNPAFDVTPARLVDVLVTEKGVVDAPDPARMAALFRTAE